MSRCAWHTTRRPTVKQSHAGSLERVLPRLCDLAPLLLLIIRHGCHSREHRSSNSWQKQFHLQALLAESWLGKTSTSSLESALHFPQASGCVVACTGCDVREDSVRSKLFFGRTFAVQVSESLPTCARMLQTQVERLRFEIVCAPPRKRLTCACSETTNMVNTCSSLLLGIFNKSAPIWTVQQMEDPGEWGVQHSGSGKGRNGGVGNGEGGSGRVHPHRHTHTLANQHTTHVKLHNTQHKHTNTHHPETHIDRHTHRLQTHPQTQTHSLHLSRIRHSDFQFSSGLCGN